MSAFPLVSVSVITYNHAPYIAQCLDSILEQRTNFPFEILLGEDDSTDGTREICQAYAKKYPEQIRLFLRSDADKIYINGKKTGRYNYVENIKAARGSFVAICDGDDYWCDPDKLQLQVDYMREHPDCAIVHHAVRTLYTQDGVQVWGKFQDRNRQGDLKKILRGNFIVHSSVLFRNQGYESFPDWFYRAPMADWMMHILNAHHGHIAYLPREMSVYRLHAGGLWSLSSADQRARNTVDFIRFLQREVFTGSKAKELDQAIFKQHYRVAFQLMDMRSSVFRRHILSASKYAGPHLRNWLKLLATGLRGLFFPLFSRRPQA